MSIWNAFTISVQAMQAQSTGLGAISQNIANVNTTAYKAADVTFADMVSDQGAMGSSTLFNANGILSSFPGQINSMGVTANERNEIDIGGTMQSTGNWNDLALTGKGFFVVNSAIDGSGSGYYTRDGALGTTDVSSMTASTSTAATSASTSTTGPGPTYLTDQSGHYLMGWPAGTSPSDSAKSLSAVHYQLGSILPGQATANLTLSGTVPANAANGSSAGVPVYDDQGDMQTLNVNFNPVAGQPDTYNVSFSFGSGSTGATPTAPTTPVTVSFDGNGNMQAASAQQTLNVTWADGKTGAINVDMSKLRQLASSQFQLDNTTQDGYPAMQLSQVSFDGQGNLMGTYEPPSTLPNGQPNTQPAGSKTMTLYTLAVATFPSPNSLSPVNGSLYAQTAGSGNVTISSVSQLGHQTGIAPGTLEGSNVNLENEFSTMITTQQAYNSAAQVLKTSDTMTQQTTNLIT